VSAAATARAYIAALNTRDSDRIAACVTDDFVNEHLSIRGHSLTGRAAYRSRLDVFLATFPVLDYEIEDVVAEDDRAMVAYRMRADYAGADGMATPKPIDVRGVFRLVFRDGLVAYRADYRDAATVEHQLGLR
jgi:steroid delta-isomerase-like uncharacterized protein